MSINIDELLSQLKIWSINYIKYEIMSSIKDMDHYEYNYHLIDLFKFGFKLFPQSDLTTYDINDFSVVIKHIEGTQYELASKYFTNKIKTLEDKLFNSNKEKYNIYRKNNYYHTARTELIKQIENDIIQVENDKTIFQHDKKLDCYRKFKKYLESLKYND